MSLEIVVVRAGLVIADSGAMPCIYVPRIFRFIEEKTKGGYVVIDSKTLRSRSKQLGRKTMIMPGRKIVVLTSEPKITKEFPDCAVASGIDEILNLSKKEKVLINGGESVFRQFITRPEVTTMHVAHIRADLTGNGHFPEYPFYDWTLEHSEFIKADNWSKFSIAINTLKRRIQPKP